MSPAAHEIVEVCVVASCACGARGEGESEAAALDDLDANCVEVDAVIEVLDGDDPVPAPRFSMHRYFQDKARGRR
jgi:hypothetical protein